MKQKALHDFANNDYRLHGQLLVRLNFVRTWSAARTLAYYKVIRKLVYPMLEDMYDGAYMIDESLPKVPSTRQLYPGLTPGTMVPQYRYKMWLKAPYDGEQYKQFVSDFDELERYRKALQWICSQKDDVPANKKRTRTQRINTYGKYVKW